MWNELKKNMEQIEQSNKKHKFERVVVALIVEGCCFDCWHCSILTQENTSKKLNEIRSCLLKLLFLLYAFNNHCLFRFFF